MTELLRLAPSTAVLITRDESGHTVAEEEVPTALIQRGDLLKVRLRCSADELGLWLTWGYFIGSLSHLSGTA